MSSSLIRPATGRVYAAGRGGAGAVESPLARRRRGVVHSERRSTTPDRNLMTPRSIALLPCAGLSLLIAMAPQAAYAHDTSTALYDTTGQGRLWRCDV